MAMMVRSALVSILCLFVGSMAVAAQADDSSTFKVLDEILRHYPEIQTLGEFVEKLPVAYKDNWTAAFKSRGLAQGFTTAEDPRVLSFGKDDLVLTFTACKDQKKGEYGYYSDCQALEAIDFNRKTNQFELIVYSFPGKNDRGLKPRVSEKNPQRCLTCHGGAEAKPLWEPYNFWPGTYGSITGRGAEFLSYNSREYAGYNRFLNAHWDTKTGKSLSSDDPYTKFTMRWNELVTDRKAREQGFVASIHGTNRMPNRALTEIFYKANFTRIARKLVTRTKFENEKYLLAWWSRCFQAILPDTYNINKWAGDFGIDDLYQRTYRQLTPYSRLRDELEEKFRADYRAAVSVLNEDSSDLGGNLFAEREAIFYNESAPMLKRLAEILGDIDVEQWNLSFKLQQVNFATPAFGLAQFQSMLRSQVAEKAPELSRLNCADLKNESKNRLK